MPFSQDDHSSRQTAKDVGVSSAEDRYRKNDLRRKSEQDKRNAAERARAEKLARGLNDALPKLVIYLSDNPTGHFKWITVDGEEVVGWEIYTAHGTETDSDGFTSAESEYYLLSTGEVVDRSIAGGRLREVTITADTGIYALETIHRNIIRRYGKHQSPGRRLLLSIFAPKKIFPRI